MIDSDLLNDSNRVSDLTADDIENVSGGILPLIPIAYFGIGMSAGVLVAGYSWIGGLRAGYNVNHH